MNRSTQLILLAAILGIVSWLFTTPIVETTDIASVDDTFYLRNGDTIPEKGMPPTGGWPWTAPLQATIYFGLLHIETKDQVIGLFSQLAALLASLGCVWALAATRLKWWQIALVAIPLTLCTGLTRTEPKIVVTNIVILLFTLGAVLRARNPATKFALGTTGALLAVYCRQEMIWAIIPLFAITIGCLWRNRHTIPREDRKWWATACLIAGTAMLVFGSPIPRGGRSWVAIQQHMAVNLDRKIGDDGVYNDPWEYPEQVLEPIYGKAESVTDLITGNPVAFAKHMLHNVVRIPVQSVRTCLTSGNTGRNSDKLAIGLSILSMAGLWIMALLPEKRPDWKTALNSTKTLARRPELWICFLWIAPTIAACVVISPLYHYTSLWVIIPVTLAAVWQREQQPKPWVAAAGLAAAAILLAIPHSSNYPPEETPVRNAVRTLQAENVPGEKLMLLGDQWPAYFLTENWHDLFVTKGTMEILPFIQEKQPDAIIAFEGGKLQGYPDWHHIGNDPAKFGYRQVPLENPKNTLLVRTKPTTGK